jgi:hypothetical protein
MLRLLAAIGSAALIGGGMLSSQSQRHQTTDDVLGLFNKNCGSCHVRPDAKFKTDRAWIERISGTT